MVGILENLHQQRRVGHKDIVLRSPDGAYTKLQILERKVKHGTLLPGPYNNDCFPRVHVHGVEEALNLTD